ncbi:DUF6418 domain-containing protein [Mangrovibacter plantisponsor]|uniref:DUF6418 domain-containing protein n=1 Tax=Mangrovibacter plantisponsor TaxID=451513 RepID=A0A317Q866_9ENTR|nr:DUF6418 domain-containing protein [Mangrovibacter plantisponsor]PWW11551.1 hypothetical protein DES37_102157 [Mangrovibacter plantisponsor]
MLALLFLWGCITLLSILNCISYNALNVLTILLWFLSCLYYLKKDSEFTIISVLLLTSFTITGVICAYAENNVLLSEIHQVSSPSGATTRILTLSFVIIAAAQFTFKKIGNIRFLYGCLSLTTNKVVGWLLNFSVLSLIMLMIFFRLRYGNPNEYGVDRFYYWNNIAPAWGQYAKFILQQLSLLIGVLYAETKRRYFLYFIIISILSQYIVGEKFTGLFLSLVFFITPIVLINNINIGKKIFNIKAFLIISILFSLLIYSAYLSYYSISGSSDAFNRLLNRVVLQAQMWWAVDWHSSGNMVSSTDILVHLFGFGASDESKGIRYLMSIIAPSDVFSIFMMRGVTFTMGGPVNLIYFFGFPLSIIAGVALGSYSGLIMRIIVDSIKTGDLILSLISIKLLYVLVRVITMGDFYQLFEIKTILCVIIFIIYSLMSCGMNKNRIYNMS